MFWRFWFIGFIGFLVWGFNFDELTFFGLLWGVLGVPSWWAVVAVVVMAAGLRILFGFFFVFNFFFLLVCKTAPGLAWGLEIQRVADCVLVNILKNFNL